MKLSTIRGRVRQVLKDEFSADADLEFKDDELDIYIRDCLQEISEKSPYKNIETLTTTADSRDLDISDIENLMWIYKLEYPTGSDPRDYRNFIEIDSETIEIDTTSSPAADENVYVYCAKSHELTEESSTLRPQHERLLVQGVSGRAAVAKSRKLIDSINVGGAGTPSAMQAWGLNQLALFKEGLAGLKERRVNREYPTG